MGGSCNNFTIRFFTNLMISFQHFISTMNDMTHFLRSQLERFIHDLTDIGDEQEMFHKNIERMENASRVSGTDP